MINRSATAYAREVIGRLLREFGEQTCSSLDASDRRHLDSAQLDSATQPALTALAEFDRWIPESSSAMIWQRLRCAAKIADGLHDVSGLLEMLDDRRLSSRPGMELVRDRAERRIARYQSDLMCLCAQLMSDNYQEQIEQLLANLRWTELEPEPELRELARESTERAGHQIAVPPRFDGADLTIVHDLFASVQQLAVVMELFRELLDHDEWHSVATDLDKLRRRLDPVVDCSSVEMRCTKWLEKSRIADETLALRDLIAFALEECRQHYAYLVELWDVQHASQTRAAFERALTSLSKGA